MKAFYDRQIEKLRNEGAFITDKIDQEHIRLVEEIFSKEDADSDGYISYTEYSGPKHDELWNL